MECESRARDRVKGGRVGQERVLGESGARMWVREWGKRERECGVRVE